LSQTAGLLKKYILNGSSAPLCTHFGAHFSFSLQEGEQCHTTASMGTLGGSMGPSWEVGFPPDNMGKCHMKKAGE
jgi:hypothetical protein